MDETAKITDYMARGLEWIRGFYFDSEFVRKYIKIRNIEILEFHFSKKLTNGWIAYMILNLLGLLYQTTADRKGIFTGAILSAAHASD